jgi:hypothetical protein
MPGEFGDIIWKRTPGQLELYNVPPPPEPTAPAVPEPAEIDLQRQMMEAQMRSQEERERYYREKNAYQREWAAQAPPKQKREWRRQIRDFLSEMDDPRADPIQGIQSMLDSGAMWMEEDGVYTSVPIRSEKQRQRLVDASDRWLDYNREQGMMYDAERGWMVPPAPIEFQQELFEKYGTSNDPEAVAARKQYIDDAMRKRYEDLTQTVREAGREVPFTEEEFMRRR